MALHNNCFDFFALFVFTSKITMSDESLKKLNYRLCGTEIPHITHKEPLRPLKVIVWCGVCARGVIGLYFFENTAGQTTAVNSEPNRAMLNDLLLAQLDELEPETMWFLQYRATVHSARNTTEFLRSASPGC